MNYYAPRQKVDGGWHYTKMNNGRIWPVGYCASHEPHATALEAQQCYKKFICDHAAFNQGELMDAQVKCQVPECKNHTSKSALVDHDDYYLCPTHMNRDGLEVVVRLPELITSSY
jgi:hypothetical protein